MQHAYGKHACINSYHACYSGALALCMQLQAHFSLTDIVKKSITICNSLQSERNPAGAMTVIGEGVVDSQSLTSVSEGRLGCFSVYPFLALPETMLCINFIQLMSALVPINSHVCMAPQTQTSYSLQTHTLNMLALSNLVDLYDCAQMHRCKLEWVLAICKNTLSCLWFPPH